MKKLTESWGTIKESGGAGPPRSMSASDWSSSGARLVCSIVAAFGVILLVLTSPMLLNTASQVNPSSPIGLSMGWVCCSTLSSRSSRLDPSGLSDSQKQIHLQIGPPLLVKGERG